MEGKISEETSKDVVNKNSAFVERQSTEERKWKSHHNDDLYNYRWKTDRM